MGIGSVPMVALLNNGAIPPGDVFNGGAIPAATRVLVSNGSAITGYAGLTSDASGNLTAASLTTAGTVAANLLTVAPTVATSGVQTALLVTAAADTTQTSATEKIDVNVNLNRTVQWATSPPVTQRAFVIQAPTYACDTAAQTITNAATLDVTGAPVGGTNVTITNKYAIRAEAGDVTLGNGLFSQTVTDAATSATTSVVTLSHRSNGTPAANFGNRITINGDSASNLNRNMALIDAVWTTATDASRVSKMIFWVYNIASATTTLTLTPTGATFASGVPLTCSDTTASTSGATGALIVSGGIGTAGAIWSSMAPAAATSPAFGAAGTSALAGGVTDSYTSGIRLTPGFSGVQTVTRLNYIDLNNAALSSTTLTDACVFRFDAAAGTHKAVDAGTTKTTPGAVTQWLKVNINGTIGYIASYSSKTT